MHDSQDVRYPFEEAASRVALLYALPGPPGPKRLLIVDAGSRAQALAAAWDGPVQVVAEGSVTFDAGCDVLALPGTLAAIGRDGASAPLLEALAPGGWVVGDLPHGRSPRRWRRDGPASFGRSPGGLSTPRRCLAALRAAGLHDEACFYVQPNLDSPMGLIPCDHVAARHEFLRSVRSTAGQGGRAGYALRWLVAWAGLGGLKQPDLFFWARKPC